MASEDATQFTSVDQTADPAFFLKFLDEANKLPGVSAWKAAILDGLRLQPGAQVLDMGCGVGATSFVVSGIKA
jgi:cyclopropane fatty-acyl-phospholipid synthase-like methyltransferase